MSTLPAPESTASDETWRAVLQAVYVRRPAPEMRPRADFDVRAKVAEIVRRRAAGEPG